MAGVNLFYDDSRFNKNIEGVAGGTAGDKAIDPTKTAYLPGTGTAGFGISAPSPTGSTASWSIYGRRRTQCRSRPTISLPRRPQ